MKKPSDWIIRPMQEADLDEAVRIEEETFPMPFSRELFQKFLVQEAYHCHVALIDDRLVGYILYSLVVDESDLANIAVDACSRRRGVGESLMNTMFDHIERAGGGRIFLEVRPSNMDAQAFYQRLGFFEVGRRRAYYHDSGEDALVFTKEITR